MFISVSQGYLITEPLYQATTREDDLGDPALQVKDHILQHTSVAASPSPSFISLAPLPWTLYASLCPSATLNCYPLTIPAAGFHCQISFSLCFLPGMLHTTPCACFSSLRLTSPVSCVLLGSSWQALEQGFLALPLTSHVTLGRSLDIFAHQHLHLQNEGKKTQYPPNGIMGKIGLLMHMKSLEQRLAHSQHSVSVIYAMISLCLSLFVHAMSS